MTHRNHHPGVADGAERIRLERRRHRSMKGYDPEHDFAHVRGELALAAACYAAPIALLTPAGADPWPWEEKYDKRGVQDRERALEKAGALIAAELDRLAELRGERVEVRGDPCRWCHGSGRSCVSFVGRRTLDNLASAKEPQTAAQMADRMGLKRGTAMAMRLERLRAAGLCQRRRESGAWVYWSVFGAPVLKDRAIELGHAFAEVRGPFRCYQCGEDLEHIADFVRCARGVSSAGHTIKTMSPSLPQGDTTAEVVASPCPTAHTSGLGGCRADCDGDCSWAECPQILDNEPTISGRSCPLWDRDADES